jgi:transglutaminase/protease-like cytokinesis protein 3
MTLRLLIFSLLLCFPFSNCLAQWEHLPCVSLSQANTSMKKANHELVSERNTIITATAIAPDSLELERRAKEIKGTNVEQLTQKLVYGIADESQKAYVIFRWITENISYDVVAYKQPNLYLRFWNGNLNDSEMREKRFRTGISNYVIKNKAAICSGYAYLFLSMCEIAQLEAQFITGISNTEEITLRSVESDHAWNSVKINGQWKLLDACWASGYCTDGVKVFHKKFEPYYYLCKPDKFILNHLPDDPKWALLNTIPSAKEMILYPQIYSGYYDPRITDLKSKNGILNNAQHYGRDRLESAGHSRQWRCCNFEIQHLWLA